MGVQGTTAATGWVRAYRLGFALLTVLAVVNELRGSPNLPNFFSFFTIQSNLIGAAVLLVGAVAVPRETRTWDLVRGGAAIYLTLTGVIYNTLLVELSEQLQTVTPWANHVLHKVLPIVMVVDLLLVPLAHRLSWREATRWTIYPLAYLGYSLVRGYFVDWYPYPFLDPRNDGGYPRVALFSLVVLLGFLACAWVLTEINAWRLARTPATA